IAKEVGGNKLMVNTAALGVATGVTGYDLERITEVIAENFSGRKGAQVAEANLKVAAAGYEFAHERYAELFRWKLRPLEAPRRMVMNGTEGISLGALAGGCRFMSSYPMTPASGIMEYLAGKARKYGMVVKQTGDEIEAILMAIGAAHTGVRAMAATSGGGFSLMVEALGLAGATETPLVVVEAQRPGPSTGLPTQTEQGDLLFLLHASQGEFPRMLLAPGTIEQCFEATWRAFNMAEKYQTPVLVLTDHFLQNSLRSIPRGAIDFASVEIDRGLLLTDEELERLPDGYRRYQVTESGISPRALPGHPKAVFHVTSDEHTEDGFITEEADMRIAQMEKRMRKLEAAKKDIRDPGLYGPEKADVTLVCWGSTYGAVREAVDRLNNNGLSANMLHIVDVWPFPSERVGEMLSKANYRIMVEGNYTGQMARLIRAETGIAMDFNVLRYDGRPFSPEYVLRKLERVLEVRV
ncbi:MAG: 2-oxoacid:acceptor oxidoreductase subunit alpha, partial [Chloroflexi bacterium]|nr:2-oxoacid:acceptor oxidoreductase subunit alpha [Chloroflexota bacterium]